MKTEPRLVLEQRGGGGAVISRHHGQSELVMDSVQGGKRGGRVLVAPALRQRREWGKGSGFLR